MNEKGEYGYINKNRAEVIHCQYRNVRDFSGGLAGVKNEKGKYGYVNKAGEEVIPCLYDYIWDVSEELVKVEKDGKWGDVNIVIVKKGTFCYLLSLPNPKRDEKRDELVKMYTKLWDTSPQSRDALNNEKFEENNEKNPLNAKK